MTARSLIVVIIVSVFICASSRISKTDELSDRLLFWEPPHAFLCSDHGIRFPSKWTSNDPSSCDDGDMTLFNGLLCAAGDRRGCDGVSNAQDAGGRFWRSPRR